MGELQLIQLRRILAAGDDLTADNAQARLAAESARVAEAFFAEAAENDDVTSTSAALDFLEGRLAFFGDLIDHAIATRIRTRFNELLAAWEA